MPLSVADARARAAKAVDKSRREWAARGDEGLGALSIPLKPPTEREVLADPRAASDWAESWRNVQGAGLQVSWALKNWPSVGRQELPERLSLHTADTIARFAGPIVYRDWVRIRDRAGELRARFGDGDEIVAAIQRRGGSIDRQSDLDFALLLEVLTWLRRHPSSGYRLRQVPIPGMHTKWLGAHRALVESLYAAITGEPDLGLVPSPEMLRIRILDPEARPGGLSDVTAPIDELAALQIRPRIVIVCENLESVLALPDWPGAVAIHGGGYAVPIHRLPWARASRVLYWGDLDADGFAILHRLRSNGIDAVSVLMDEITLAAHRDLWVPDPNGVAVRMLPSLTQSEKGTLDRIAAEGGVRLEQERLPWPLAIDALRVAADRR
ncbi:Wadjet anti-phage system protein JetD domain-containing protein [Microbacterium sp. NPDC089987]|uniref:Wadjet anti-phage system protein JetD domain-containing protein n=1 Tax=Microbacterium sp. NPDC089987 TaxID=3364202 RepID=UPI0037F9A7BF